MRFPRPTRRGLALATGGIAIAAVAFTVDPSALLDDEEVAAGPVVRDTATVERTTLATEYGTDATAAYRADATAYISAPPGEEVTTTSGSGRTATTQVSVIPPSMVVTQLVTEGSVVEQGQVLWRLGNEPTVVLYGAEPSFRDLAEGDEGPDVLQLETALVALGHDPDATVTVDETFTAATEAMVERWQESIDAEVDGVVHLGSVVYVDGASRVGDSELMVGATALAGQAAFDLRTLDTEITFTLVPADRETLAVGDVVQVRIGAPTTATVVSMTVTDDGGAAVVAIPDEPVELASDEVPAEVEWSIELAADVVTVPAEAIVRTDDQQRWVEVRDPDGSERWVAVQVGRASGGRVEVIGEIAPGDLVIVP